MRLLWLSHLVPWPPRGGVLQRSYHLLREAAARHEVQLLALNQRAVLPTPDDVEAARAELRTFCASVEVHPIPADASRWRWASMVARGLLRSTPYDVNWLRSRAFADRARALAAGGDFDLVHVDTLGLHPYAAAFRGVPIALNHHNVESHMMARRAATAGRSPLRGVFALEARKLARLEARACPAAAANLVVSSLDGDRLRAAVGDVALAVVPNGVDLDFFRPPASAAPPARRLIFAGGMSWYPNREAVRFLVAEIWPALAAADPGWDLEVVGADPAPELLAAAERDRRISAPGFVDDVRPHLHRAAVYVCPIRDGGGTRLKVLDALAAGRPLVATRLAVEGLELAEEAHYLAAETPAEFVRQIRRLGDDPGTAAALAARGRAFVAERFAWPVVGRQLEAAYAEALDRGRKT